jgi:hypothetical protein
MEFSGGAIQRNVTFARAARDWQVVSLPRSTGCI